MRTHFSVAGQLIKFFNLNLLCSVFKVKRVIIILKLKPHAL